GLQVPIITESKGTPETERVTVVGRDPETVGGGGGPGGGGGGGGEGGGHGLRGRLTLNGLSREYVWPARNSNSNTLQNPPAQNPPSPSNFVVLGPPILQAVAVTLPSGEQYVPMTTIKNLAQARVLGRFIGSPVPIFVPPGQNPQATINYWGSPTFPGYPTFINDFMPTGTNDFKQPSKGGPNAAIYDAYGNFLYGASGTAAGIPASLLQGMGHAFHGGQNDPVNVYDIQLGIDVINTGGTISVVPVDLTGF
ncbi:MAG TPA: hypothetical protein VFA65_11030, partial [Bryobacteraceae bacterium]|nr:hypothetical protein [Bryobacteraceae bacterium]